MVKTNTKVDILVYRKTYRYRLFTTFKQEKKLTRYLELHRRLYNTALDGKRMCWETVGCRWSYLEQAKWFAKQRQESKPFFGLASHSGQHILRRLDKAYSAFFKRVKKGEKPGFPRFKSYDRFNSFILTYKYGCRIIKEDEYHQEKLKLQNIGKVRVNWHKQTPKEAVIKEVVIKRYLNKWYVSFVVELPKVKLKCMLPTRVGIDLGLTSFVTTDKGGVLGDSKILEDRLPELKRRHRALSRCKRGSGRRLKVKNKLVKCYKKITNTRKDLHHKVAKGLVDKYGLIVAEKLDIKQMLEKGKISKSLNRKISGAGWGNFIEILVDKAEEAGHQVILVDPQYTSQICSGCGCLVEKPLSQRTHKCVCGLTLGRDVNAARNILNLGILAKEKSSAKLVRAGPEVDTKIYGKHSNMDV